MTWLLLVGAVWMALAVLVGWLVGRSIRLADRRQPRQAPFGVPDGVPDDWTCAQPQADLVAVPTRRRPRIRRERR